MKTKIGKSKLRNSEKPGTSEYYDKRDKIERQKLINETKRENARGVFVKWKEKSGSSEWSEPYWRKSESPQAACKDETEWNKYDNPYDKIKLLEISRKKPNNLKKRNKLGTYYIKKVK